MDVLLFIAVCFVIFGIFMWVEHKRCEAMINLVSEEIELVIKDGRERPNE